MWAVIAVALATSFYVASASQVARPPAADKTLSLYEEIRSIRRPITVEHIGLIGDGGSTSIRLKDARGRVFFLCKDFHSRTAVADSTGQLKRDTSPRLIFFGAESCLDSLARPCGVGSREEAALVDILQSYVLSTLTAAERDSLNGPWRKGYPALPFRIHSEKWKAKVVVTVIRQLKDQRERLERLGLPVYE